MDTYKLKLKIGIHEFDAEGPRDAVEKQFSEFKEMIEKFPASPVALRSGGLTSPGNPQLSAAEGTAAPGLSTDADSLRKIFRLQGKALSLSALPQGDSREKDAALLILLGYKLYHSVDELTGSTLLDDLKQSGYPLTRADRILEPYIEGADKLVIRTGQRRGVRYRLTNPGHQRAMQIARELAEMVP
jgi:hypothetical protein